MAPVRLGSDKARVLYTACNLAAQAKNSGLVVVSVWMAGLRLVGRMHGLTGQHCPDIEMSHLLQTASFDRLPGSSSV